MEDLRTTANLLEVFENGNPVAILSRRELDSMFKTGERAQLWLELGREDDDDVRLLSVDLSTTDIAQMLERSTGDDVLLALDGSALHGLFDDAEVEAHGFRGALAIAVVAGAIAAPAGMAANPLVSTASGHGAASSHVQAANPASKAQVSAASNLAANNPASRAQAAKPQVSAASNLAANNPASRAQAAKPQVSQAASKALGAKPATAKAQVSKTLVAKPAAKAQFSKTLVIKASGLRLLTPKGY